MTDDYRKLMTFVWLLVDGTLHGAFVVDGRDCATPEEAQAVQREAVEVTRARLPLGDAETVRLDLDELARWPNWREYRQRFEVFGPVEIHKRREPRPPLRPLVAGPYTPREAEGPQLHWERFGEIVVLAADGENAVDPILGRRARGYGLNPYTGEFEPETRRAVECANGADDDDTWPLSARQFVRSTEREREAVAGRSFYQRQDKPEIFALYDGEECSDARHQQTFELWEQALRRRAFYLADGEPVRLALAEDGTVSAVHRLDPRTGRILPAGGPEEAAGLADGGARRVTEQTYIVAVEQLRRQRLTAPEQIAALYAQADGETARWAVEAILNRTFDRWAEELS